jgi:hypothetical protein
VGLRSADSNSRSDAAVVGYAASANLGPTVVGIVLLWDVIIRFAHGVGPAFPKGELQPVSFLFYSLAFMSISVFVQIQE